MNGRKKSVKRLIFALLLLQGLYVIFPLPDIWPVSNYSMFSRVSGGGVASSIQIAGVSGNGETELKAAHILPFDIVRLEKGINRILHREQYEKKNEDRINRIVDAVAFIPFDGDRLKRFIKNKILYGRGGARSAEEKLDSVFNYLSAQYLRNGGAENFSEMRLYLVTRNWTDAKPPAARTERALIYSTKKGMRR